MVISSSNLKIKTLMFNQVQTWRFPNKKKEKSIRASIIFFVLAKRIFSLEILIQLL
jgi:hypothetical protein